ncbi:MAG: hypothetical protein PUB69_03240 [Desulfovibrionaceae bacterium]|nr:hypothetical protein [Desulfovibrionaceae bacterium]
MDIKQEIFLDGVSKMHFIRGMIRLDLYRMEPLQNGEAEPDDFARLLMTPQGFLSLYEAVNQMAKGLKQSGLFPNQHLNC